MTDIKEAHFMDKKHLIYSFWKAVANQEQDVLKEYFAENASIKWHNTNESFTTTEYLIANCEYPDDWDCEVERTEIIGDLVISVTRVWKTNQDYASFHATSFFEFEGEKIVMLNEYWGDDGKPPKWRIDKRIGRQIKPD